MKLIAFDLVTNSNWKWRALHNPLDLWMDLARETLWFIRRGLYGYSRMDVWNADEYLIDVIPGLVRGLQNGHVHPHGTTPEEWHTILEKIACGFEAARRMNAEWTWKRDEGKADQQLYDEGLTLFKEYFPSLWD